MIFKGSRYEKLAASAYTVVSADGRQHRSLPIRFAPVTPATYQHTLTSNERLDTLAFHFYGNAEKFWLIADANPVIDPESLLEPGRPILIPPEHGG
jgi:nucleoid-associated protein YgaU